MPKKQDTNPPISSIRVIVLTDKRKIMEGKMREIIPIILIMCSLIFAGCAGGEALCDERAYRTAIDPDVEYYDEIEAAIAVDPPGTVNLEEIRRQAMEALNIINAERAGNNLAPIRWDADLEYCAYIRAEELTSRFDHIRPNGMDWYMVSPQRILGENIYKGKKTADKALESWMKNKADRDNFLCGYFNRMGIGIFETANGEYYWAIEFGSDMITVSFEDDVEPASVWVITDTESNRKTSIWGTAMIKTEELGKEYRAGIPQAGDDKYLFRMIDEDGIYYDANIPELKDGWKLNLYSKDGNWESYLNIYDENDNLIQECSVFSAAL